jgi:hypothetical protein
MRDKREDAVWASTSDAGDSRDCSLIREDWRWYWAMGSFNREVKGSGFIGVLDSMWISSVWAVECVINKHLLGKCVVIGMWSELYCVKGIMGQKRSVIVEVACSKIDLEMMMSSIMDGRLEDWWGKCVSCLGFKEALTGRR